MKIWTPAEDEHLQTIAHWRLDRIARRMGCTEQEAKERIALLGRTPNSEEQHGAPFDEALPKGITAAKVAANLSGLQRGLIETTAHHKALGQHLTAFNEWAASALSEVELAELIKLAMQSPRQSGETVAEKIARKLTEQTMTLPKLQ